MLECGGSRRMERGGGTLMKHGGGKMRCEVSFGVRMVKLSNPPPFTSLSLLWNDSWQNSKHLFYHRRDVWWKVNMFKGYVDPLCQNIHVYISWFYFHFQSLVLFTLNLRSCSRLKSEKIIFLLSCVHMVYQTRYIKPVHTE